MTRGSFAAVSLAVVLMAAVGLYKRPAPPLPVLFNLPAFALTERSGREITLRSLAGHAFVADFIFTHCAGVCPAMTARMARLQKELPGGVLLVSFTVDPRNDTPETLAGYARDFGAGPTWLFLTGPPESLYRVATQGFKLEAFEVPPEQQQAGGDGPFLHSSKFVLVDGRGRIRGYYDSTDEAAVQRLVADVRRGRGEGS